MDTPDLYQDMHYLITAAITLLMIVLAVLAHYEGLRTCSRWLAGTRMQHRMRIICLIYALLTLHLLEIFFFGTAYWLLALDGAFGHVYGDAAMRFVDYVYFSATVYSTLGFGDLVPTGPIRFIAGMESVTGLLLITWSASFTYLEMVKHWHAE